MDICLNVVSGERKKKVKPAAYFKKSAVAKSKKFSRQRNDAEDAFVPNNSIKAIVNRKRKISDAVNTTSSTQQPDAHVTANSKPIVSKVQESSAKQQVTTSISQNSQQKQESSQKMDTGDKVQADLKRKFSTPENKTGLMLNVNQESDGAPLNKKRKFGTDSAKRPFEKFNDKTRSDVHASDQNSKLHSKSGKISSLFGNNPIVPHIGQRFVRPIDEKVFTAEKFSDLNIHPHAVANLEQNFKITKMTTVQKKAIPVIMSGKDVLIRSQTGSGKTLAYALPIIEKLQSVRPKLHRKCGIKALVIVPTRELAQQTYNCFLKLVKAFVWIVPGIVAGGTNNHKEKDKLRKGINVLVATPGRLLDHIKSTKALTLDSVQTLVLDEADRMFDMGYEKDISAIVEALKGAEPESNNSDYNPMQLLKQHINPDEQKEDVDKDIVGKKNEDKREVEDEDEDEDSEKKKQIEEAIKRYHSGSEDESDDESDKLQKKSVTDDKKSEETDVSPSNDNLFRRQTILLSATLTQKVDKLAGLTMKNPTFVDAAKDNIEAVNGDMSEVNEDWVVPQTVTQSYIVTPPKLRLVALSAFIASKFQSQKSHKMLVFMATRGMVEFYTEILSTVLCEPDNEEYGVGLNTLDNVQFFKLHGDMAQKDRDKTFKDFCAAESGVLLSTDVGARGLNWEVNTVVQYTGPTSLSDYVHRAGRAGRAGALGSAVIFLVPSEVEFVRSLESRRIRIKQDVDVEVILKELIGRFTQQNDWKAGATNLQNKFESLVLENKEFKTMAFNAYTSWVRFYSSYPVEMRSVFNRKELHLGHFAKSFALRETPRDIGGAAKKDQDKKKTDQRKRHQKPNNRNGNNKRRDSMGHNNNKGPRKQFNMKTSE
ncbi:probable ATP-dependent RNA helicase DDX31 [Trichogramma pretiosum]|uniref:probable ATP-dependent RNA helicase DDX31 n=1 Tax=Trichogramma pretiosum TaxID=7493 RepID=UPI0006C9D2F5|nr:probable ATP-dependent RNA helicase DDX31 [Trichogramma pretiosum]